MLAASAPGASSSVTVTFNVTGSTVLDASACQSARADQGTSFGSLPAGSTGTSGADCSVTFGSGSDTSMLRIAQLDQHGSAMYAPADGTLDTSFAGGYATFDEGGDEYLYAAVQQPDGKLVVSGYYNDDVIVARYLQDGTQDPSFGPGGTAIIDLGGNEDARAVALQPDGKIVIAGSTDLGGDNQVFVARLDALGGLDTAGFGVGGIRYIDPTGNNDAANQVFIEDDGSITIGGAANGTAGIDETSVDSSRFFVARVNSSGNIDTNYGTSSGWTIMPGTMDNIYRGGTHFDDGRIMLGGNDSYDAIVASFDADGQPDPAFGGGSGRVAIDLGGDDYAQSVIAAPDGGVFVGGNTDAVDPDFDISAFKLTASGGLDSSWGDGDGISDFISIGVGPFDDTFGVTLQASGRLLVFGHYDPAGPDDRNLAIVSFDTDGSPSSTFGTNGIWTKDISTDEESTGNSIALADGRLAMLANDPNDAFILVFKGWPIPNYDADGEDNIPGNGDDDDFTTADAALFGACLRTVSGAGVSGTWTEDPGANCAATDTDAWNAVPATLGAPGSKVAESTTVGTVDATVALRFGVRTAPDQRLGSYVAPVVFEVVAPTG